MLTDKANITLPFYDDVPNRPEAIKMAKQMYTNLMISGNGNPLSEELFIKFINYAYHKGQINFFEI